MFQTQATPEPWQSPPYRFAATAAAPLGVGVLFTPAMRGFVRQHREAFDFVGIVPEAFWPDTDPMGIERTTAIHAALRVLDEVAADKPLVAHRTGAAQRKDRFGHHQQQAGTEAAPDVEGATAHGEELADVIPLHVSPTRLRLRAPG